MNDNSESNYIIGIDVGGTKMSAVLFDGVKVLADYSLATPKDNLNHFLVMIDALIKPLEDKANGVKIKGVGVGIPGVLSSDNEKSLKCPNVPILNNVFLRKKLEEKIRLPVKMDNDANCFARAESLMGAGKGYKNVYGIIIGTGIGGALWMNNEIYKGAHGGAGEPGSMIIDFNDPIGLEGAYHKLMQNNPFGMAQEAYKGDVLATKAYDELGNILGMAFANIVNLVDPEIIVIGGGASRSTDLFLSRARKTMKEYIISKEAKKIKAVKNKLGARGGAIGAALLV